MKKHNNTWTIIHKEFARFFGDRQLIFTSVILPGLMIYAIYSLIGAGIHNMETMGKDEPVIVRVENLPHSIEPLFSATDSSIALIHESFTQEDINALQDKEINAVLLRFPIGFDSLIAHYNPQSGEPAPNIEIYYNSANTASNRVFNMLEIGMTTYENSQSNLFDINRADSEGQRFNQASDDQILGDVFSKLLPMLIIMMLFSGVTALAPSSIAGEKERGTIATLLVTPMRRNELAIGKIVSLSCIALLSGISSFIGIALSLPKMIMQPGGESIDIPFHYATADYLALLLIIFAAVLIMVSVASLLSALAKDVKNAGTMTLPLMLILMFVGLLPMFQSDPVNNLILYLIPFYNSIQVMTNIFAHSLNWTEVAVTLASNIAYTAVAVWGLTRMFNSEKVMFSR